MERRSRWKIIRLQKVNNKGWLTIEGFTRTDPAFANQEQEPKFKINK